MPLGHPGRHGRRGERDARPTAVGHRPAAAARRRRRLRGAHCAPGAADQPPQRADVRAAGVGHQAADRRDAGGLHRLPGRAE